MKQGSLVCLKCCVEVSQTIALEAIDYWPIFSMKAK
jgi:hypothetical protein